MKTVLWWVGAGLAGFALVFFLGAGLERDFEGFDEEWAP
jgi:hypothetical protein